jgi:ribosomal protein S2, bacterial type
MSVVSIKDLLEAGVHFGHQKDKWNPKMKKYIYDARNGIHIIDLETCVSCVDDAYAFVKDIVSQGKSILFVGTKKQAQEAIKEEAERCGMFYIDKRWLGGTLTNFKTIRTRIERLNKINNMEILGDFNLLPKKEVLKLKATRDKLENNLGGIKNMRGLPGCLFVVDLQNEDIAIKEAHKMGIPIVGVVDTNCNPDLVTKVIPGNDDAIRSIQLFASLIANAVLEAKQGESYVPVANSEEPEAQEEQVQEEPKKEEVEVKKEVKTEDALEKAIKEKEQQKQKQAAKKKGE